MVRSSPEIDWYHHKGASAVPTYIIHSPASNLDKHPYKVKCHIRAQCAPHQQIPPKKDIFNLVLTRLIILPLGP